MSRHEGDALAKRGECWPGRQAPCPLILALLLTLHSGVSRETGVSAFPVCAVPSLLNEPWTSVCVCTAQKMSKSPKTAFFNNTAKHV